MTVEGIIAMIVSVVLFYVTLIEILRKSMKIQETDVAFKQAIKKSIIILIPILFVSAVILVNSYVKPDEVPSFFGWKPFIVLSGSMETKILAGDVVVVKEVDTQTLKKGDIIAFKENDIVITHRIDEIVQEDGETKYITKGDNNNTEDTEKVTYSKIAGKCVLTISHLGKIILMLDSKIIVLVIILIILILSFYKIQKYEKMENRREKKKIEENKKGKN